MQKSRVVPLIPYIAVAVGMFALSSAWPALALYHLGILLTLVFQRRGEPSVAKSRLSLPWLVPITLVFALGGVLFYLLWPLLGRDGQLVAGRLAVLGITRRGWPLFASYFCLVNPVLEELFWRGCLGSDSRLLTRNDLLFAGYHSFVLVAFANPVWVVPVFMACAFAGWLWRRIRVLSGGLLLPILTHIAADASIVMAVHLRAIR